MVVAANHPALTAGWWLPWNGGSSQPSCAYLLVGSYHGTVVAANHPAHIRWLVATMGRW
jgi:hypothetical protein